MRIGDMVEVVGYRDGTKDVSQGGNYGKILPVDNINFMTDLFKVGDNWYPAPSLKLQPAPDKFKKGDMVKVIGPMCGNYTPDEYDEIGKIFPIQDMATGNANECIVNHYVYPASSLELQPAPTAPGEFKKGDFVRVVGPIQGSCDLLLGGQFDHIYPIDHSDDTGCHQVGAFHYPESSLELQPNAIAPMPIAPMPDDAHAPAMRFNDGKPQLSYLLDFPIAFPALLKAPPAVMAHTTDFITCVSEFYKTDDIDHLISFIRRELLPELQKSISGESIHLSMRPVEQKSLTDLLTAYPDAFDDLVNVCSNGTIKYSRGNWKGGFSTETLIDYAIRHYRKYKTGVMRDVIDLKMENRWEDDSDLREMFRDDYDVFTKQFATHHLSHVMWNLMVLIEQAAQ